MNQPSPKKFDRKIMKKTAIQIKTLDDMQDQFDSQVLEKSVDQRHQNQPVMANDQGSGLLTKGQSDKLGKLVGQGDEKPVERTDRPLASMKEPLKAAQGQGISPGLPKDVKKPAVVKTKGPPILENDGSEFVAEDQDQGYDQMEVQDGFQNDETSELSSPELKNGGPLRQLEKGSEQQISKVSSDHLRKEADKRKPNQFTHSSHSPKKVSETQSPKTLPKYESKEKIQPVNHELSHKERESSLQNPVQHPAQSHTHPVPNRRPPGPTPRPVQKQPPQATINRPMPTRNVADGQSSMTTGQSMTADGDTDGVSQKHKFDGPGPSTMHQRAKVINSSHSRLFPFRSSDTNELTSLLSEVTRLDHNYTLVNAVLPNKFFIVKSIFKEAGDLTLSGLLNIEDEWFHYYLQQFMLYQPDSDYYEPWEVVVMSLFNYHNKILNIQAVSHLQSERYVDINPTKVLLDLASGNFRSDDKFFLVFCYAVAKDCFHPEALEDMIENYLDSIRDLPEAESRMAMLCALHPRALLHEGVATRILAGVSEDNEAIAVLAELLKSQIKFNTDTIYQALKVSLKLCEFCLRRNMVESAEEYIKFITSNRSVSQLANDPDFGQEFRRVRALYFEGFEKTKKPGNNAIGQMFGFVKGIVNSTVSKTTDTTGSKSEEVQWDPISKRWLINGQIPPDDEPEPAPVQAKPSGPPPIKRTPPQGAAGSEQQPKPAPAGKKNRFVAYQFGSK